MFEGDDRNPQNGTFTKACSRSILTYFKSVNICVYIYISSSLFQGKPNIQQKKTSAEPRHRTSDSRCRLDWDKSPDWFRHDKNWFGILKKLSMTCFLFFFPENGRFDMRLYHVILRMVRGSWLTKSSGWWLGHPSEKYESVNWDDDIPNIWENKTWQPDHQPVIVLRLWRNYTSTEYWVDLLAVNPQSSSRIENCGHALRMAYGFKFVPCLKTLVCPIIHRISSILFCGAGVLKHPQYVPWFFKIHSHFSKIRLLPCPFARNWGKNWQSTDWPYPSPDHLLHLSLFLVFLCICMYVCMYVCIYMYIYIPISTYYITD